MSHLFLKWKLFKPIWGLGKKGIFIYEFHISSAGFSWDCVVMPLSLIRVEDFPWDFVESNIEEDVEDKGLGREGKNKREE